MGKEYLDWNEYQTGDVISPSTEINKIQMGRASEEEILKFIVIGDKLYDFPGTALKYQKGLDGIKFGKICSMYIEK